MSAQSRIARVKEADKKGWAYTTAGNDDAGLRVMEEMARLALHIADDAEQMLALLHRLREKDKVQLRDSCGCLVSYEKDGPLGKEIAEFLGEQ